jgi:hypothetical protein
MTAIAFNKAFIYLTSVYQNVYFTSVTIWLAFSLFIWNNFDKMFLDWRIYLQGKGQKNTRRLFNSGRSGSGKKKGRKEGTCSNELEYFMLLSSK